MHSNGKPYKILPRENKWTERDTARPGFGICQVRKSYFWTAICNGGLNSGRPHKGNLDLLFEVPFKILLVMADLVSYAAVFGGVARRSPRGRLLKTEPHSFPDLQRITALVLEFRTIARQLLCWETRPITACVLSVTHVYESRC